MSHDKYQRRLEEEVSNLNQVEDIETAREMAHIEKPIRDLSRDPEVHANIRELRPCLDKEAERRAMDTVRIKGEMLRLPLTVIPLSNRNRGILEAVANDMGLETIGDLVRLLRTEHYGKLTISARGHRQIEEWLRSHNLLQ